MKVGFAVLAMVLLACGVTACLRHAEPSRQGPPAIQETRPDRPDPANPHQETNDRFVKEISQQIAGRENEPAEAVFENIEITTLKKVPAKRFLRIMNAGYSRALGVACTHCHVEDDFASDEKRPKQAAREMAALHKMINDQIAKMAHLEERQGPRFINCSTCHRGAIDPMR